MNKSEFALYIPRSVWIYRIVCDFYIGLVMVIYLSFQCAIQHSFQEMWQNPFLLYQQQPIT